jgi:hypothetical protein
MINAQSAFNPAAYALVFDAMQAGLDCDVGDALHAWQKPTVVQAETPIAPIAAPQSKPVVSVLAAASPAVIPEKPSVWRLWHRGEAGGVVVVISGAVPPEGQALKLLGNMLKAVGMHEHPLGFVGLEGDAPKGGLAEPLAAEIALLQPKHTLLMGQGVLAAACGKAMGVEGWHAAPQACALQGNLGVTYPLDLLLKKPLFKGLAWQHLQRWQQGI